MAQSIQVMDPAATKRSYIQPMVFHDGICLAKVCDVIFGIVFFDCRDVCFVFQVRNGFIEVLIVFLLNDFFEFFAMVAGVRFEIFVTIENV
jgi:hypothetical protein